MTLHMSLLETLPVHTPRNGHWYEGNHLQVDHDLHRLTDLLAR